ncbi:PfkB family carbohydrate kinase [Nocardia sp. 2YAB30]|uniref:PfkB family carbohydrate kinase n=1 Tax=unclassified Nocardia TaxID=2637762 RepID=UPI003F974FC8
MNESGTDRVAKLSAALEGADLEKVRSWGQMLANRLRRGGRVLAVGNGGSAAQAQHLVAELVGRFESERNPLAALALTTDSAVVTAIGNDYGFDELYARQVRAHGREGDVLVAISTSGRSANVITAAAEANALGMLTFALTGPAGSALAQVCDEVVAIESSATSTIQECHLLIAHELCAAVDAALSSAPSGSMPIAPQSNGTVAEQVRRVVVVGDVLADCDWCGEVTRVSPEAPVPVLSAVSRQWRPGGAGLAAMLAAADGCEVTLMTAIGDDDPGRRIRADLAAAGVSVIDLGTMGPTPVKLRMQARGQTLVMVDDSAPPCPVGDPPPEGAKALAEANGVLVADYGRGVAAQPRLRSLLSTVARRMPVVWDPHRHGPAPVERVSVVVPNHEEAAHLSGEEAAAGDLDADVRRARNLRSWWRCGHAVVTRGAGGAVLVGSDTDPAQVFPAPRREHGDACGAGDRLAVALLEELIRARIPSTAVQRAVVVAADYVAGHRPPGPRPRGDRDVDGVAVAERVRAAGGRVVATGGCFDVLHDGHRQLLEAARAMGDCLIVLLNSDASLARLKGSNRPLVPQAQRAAMLAAFACVDAVVVFDEDTPAELLEQVRPHIWIKGGDYGATELPEAAVVQRHGGQVVFGPYLDGVSTSELIERAAAGRMVRS